MATLFLTSERLKADFANQNIADEYIRTSVLIAQDELREILGDNLYTALENKVADNTVEGTIYQEMLDSYIIPYLEFTAVAEMTLITSFKDTNMGLMSNYDQNASNNTLQTVKYVETHWKQKSEFYRGRLVKFMEMNRNDIPELQCDCKQITEPTTNKIFRTGIWLGK